MGTDEIVRRGANMKRLFAHIFSQQSGSWLRAAGIKREDEEIDEEERLKPEAVYKGREILGQSQVLNPSPP